MLRQAAARLELGRLLAPSLCRAASGAPSVYDKLVTFTVFDKSGRRHTLRGLEGQSIVEVLQANTDVLGEEVVCLGPEGRNLLDAHVKVPSELSGVVPPPASDEEKRLLAELAAPGSLDAHSRLGTRVILSKKDFDGALIALGEVAPWKTP